MIDPCEQIGREMGELYSCIRQDGFVRIRTPFLYPDGDIVDLFLVEKNGVIELTDMGETLRWLRMQTPAKKRSVNQDRLIEDACLNHGIERFKGQLMVRVKAGQQLAQSVLRLGQAAVRVSDIWFTQRPRALETVVNEVEEFLREREIPFARNEKHPGRSGREWSVDFHTRHPSQSALVTVLTTGSRSTARVAAEHTVAMWHDLSHLKIGPEALRFVSLIDDTADVWTPENLKLIESVSDDTANWSRPDEFEEVLSKAA